MDKLTQQLLDHYQRDFPLVSKPFEVLARNISSQSDAEISEDQVIEKIGSMKEQGTITRLGPIFDHRKAGASLLAAVKAAPSDIERVAAQINEFPEVNHNYQREDVYNIWFVVTASDKVHLNNVLNQIETNTGLKILRLPMEQAYHIDLGFKISHHSTSFGNDFSKGLESTHSIIDSVHRIVESPKPANEAPEAHFRFDSQPLLETKQNQLRTLVQDGLPIVQNPYQELAIELGTSEGRVLSTLQHWIDEKLVKRIGLIANHHRVGYTHNAMVVWDIPNNQVDGIGEAFKESGLVTLCYRRARHVPEWHYNLYCMIHSKDREHVEDVVKQLVENYGLQDIDRKVLFSTRQFKQKGGRYTKPAANEQSLASIQTEEIGGKISPMLNKVSQTQVFGRRAV